VLQLLKQSSLIAGTWIASLNTE